MGVTWPAGNMIAFLHFLSFLYQLQATMSQEHQHLSMFLRGRDGVCIAYGLGDPLEHGVERV
jgi:hypothetical protein